MSPKPITIEQLLKLLKKVEYGDNGKCFFCGCWPALGHKEECDFLNFVTRADQHKKTRIIELHTKISMAMRANGGPNFHEEWCKCDPDVGAVPCHYCAIFDGLNAAAKMQAMLDEMDARVVQLEDVVEVRTAQLKKLQEEKDKAIAALTDEA